jgi:hypothetical protein
VPLELDAALVVVVVVLAVLVVLDEVLTELEVEPPLPPAPAAPLPSALEQPTSARRTRYFFKAGASLASVGPCVDVHGTWPCGLRHSALPDSSSAFDRSNTFFSSGVVIALWTSPTR